MFPGQGAQRIGMGEGLFAAQEELTARADAILGYSVAGLCLDGPMERLTRTDFTQPALFVVGALAYLERRAAGLRPDWLLGHSVAEYVALFAAEVLDFESGLRLVQKRGELMARAEGGGMAAVLGLDANQVETVLREQGLSEVFAANFNTPRQIVVSGRKEAVVAAEPHFLAAGASHYRVLQVGGAFHTPFMEPARREFAAFLDGFEFRPPTIPVISNVTARPHVAAAIRARMAEQITAPVRWSDSLRYLLAKGVAFQDFEELGPAGAAIVKPMVKRTEIEAGPLEPEILAREEQVATESAAAATAEPAASPAKRLNGAAPAFGPADLGSPTFREDFGLRLAYVSGAMYQGIASVELVARMARAGLLGFFGAGGLPMAQVEQAIVRLRSELPPDASWGMNFIAHSERPQVEEDLVDVLLRHGVRVVEASAFMEVTPALVRYRAKGLVEEGGRVRATNRVVAKVSRPDVAEQFLSPPPERLLGKLLEAGRVTAGEAELLRRVPMADAITVESDSGGHTDQGNPFTLIPAVRKVRDAAEARFPEFGRIHLGAGGGIGTPEAAAAVFVLGADFVSSGSINQCTVEAGTSDVVKDMLEVMNVQDTDYAPAGDLFELGSKVQVLKKGLFFPARANKLLALYRQHESLEEIEPTLRRQIQDRYFKRSFEEVFDEIRRARPGPEVERAERQPKQRMAMVFKRYFRDTTAWALAGDLDHKVDFQIHCGPAQGAFNQWAAGGELAPWRRRHVDLIAERLLDETAALLTRRFGLMFGAAGALPRPSAP